MKQSYFTDEIITPDFFPVHNIVRRYSFKTMRLGDSYALLAVIFPNLVALLGLLRGESALFQKKDCFEYPPANARTCACRPGGRVYLSTTKIAA